MYLYLILLLAGGLVLSGCVTQTVSDGDHKMDSDLRLAIAESEAAGTERIWQLSILVRTEGKADREALTKAGLHVQTIIGDVATARGTVGAIRQAAALDDVRHLSLSGTMQPQDSASSPTP